MVVLLPCLVSLCPVLPDSAHQEASTMHAGPQRDKADRVHGRGGGVGRVPQQAARRRTVPDQWH